MTNSKQKILLVWNYDRNDWISPFVTLSDQFEFVFLSKKNENDDTASIDFERIYWHDYPSCTAVLNYVRPSKIVFMSLIHGQDIMLNIVAKQKGIETLHLQHGLTLDSDSYINYSSFWKHTKTYKKEVFTTQRVKKLIGSYKEFLYFISFLFRHPQSAFRLLRFSLLKARYGEIFALNKYTFRGMWPSKAISYTKHNAQLLHQREKFPKDIFTYIGNPTLDVFFDNTGNAIIPKEAYILLLDTAIVRNEKEVEGFGMTIERARIFYENVNKYALSKGLRLVIKRHPYSWSQPYILNHDNVSYVDQGDLPGLIHQADCIIGFRGTAMIPAVYYKNCVLISIYENTFDTYLQNHKLAQVIQFEDFSHESIDLRNIDRSKANLDQFIDKYIYNPDGLATNRLGTILKSQ